MEAMSKITAVGLILFIFAGIISCGNNHEKLTYKETVDQEALKLYQNQKLPLQFRYPSVFRVVREAVADTAGWSYSSTDKGDLVVQLKLKSSVQPKTNLEEAVFAVGRSRSSELLKDCMRKPSGFMLQSDSLRKNGRTYYYSKYSDAGAGNYYTVVQYRTIRHNYCYSVEEMVHTTNIHNYPPERGITLYDSVKVWGMLDVIWHSFRFTK